MACSWDETHGFRTWWEGAAADLITELRSSDVIVGFNVNSFDYRVLAMYGDTSGLDEKTFDILDEIRKQAGRVSGSNLNALASLNLGETKTFSGEQAVDLFRTGRMAELESKCRQDVELTHRLLEVWETSGLIWLSETNYVIWPGPIYRELD